jgi:hypothetical protein
MNSGFVEITEIQSQKLSMLSNRSTKALYSVFTTNMLSS